MNHPSVSFKYRCLFKYPQIGHSLSAYSCSNFRHLPFIKITVVACLVYVPQHSVLGFFVLDFRLTARTPCPLEEPSKVQLKFASASDIYVENLFIQGVAVKVLKDLI